MLLHRFLTNVSVEPTILSIRQSSYIGLFGAVTPILAHDVFFNPFPYPTHPAGQHETERFEAVVHTYLYSRRSGLQCLLQSPSFIEHNVDEEC